VKGRCGEVSARIGGKRQTDMFQVCTQVRGTMINRRGIFQVSTEVASSSFTMTNTEVRTDVFQLCMYAPSVEWLHIISVFFLRLKQGPTN
jgi:hypothetical protein